MAFLDFFKKKKDDKKAAPEGSEPRSPRLRESEAGPEDSGRDEAKEVGNVKPKKGVGVDVAPKGRGKKIIKELPKKQEPKVKKTTEEKNKTKDKAIKAQPRKKISKTVEAYKWIKWPHVTEKATDLTGVNKYTFKVVKGANKFEIAKVVEDLYSVNVIGVNTINIPRKKRRIRKKIGYKSGYKKAIVTLAEGDKIEILPH